MSDTKNELQAKLLKAQQELTAAQQRVAELEVHSSENQSQFALELLRITHEASDFEAAMEATLRLICKYSGWAYGEIWIPNQDRTLLVYGPVHYVEPTTFQHLSAFHAASEICTFAPGEGLIGRVWESNTPEWITDLFQLTEAEFKRREKGVETGLHGMVAVPVSTNNQVEAVLGFGTYEILTRDNDMVHLIATAAQQVGTVLRSKQTESALKRYAQRMEILHEIDLGLIEGGSIQALVEVTLRQLRQLVPCQRADVSIMDEVADEALVFAVGLDNDTTLGPGVRVPIPPDVFEGYDVRHLRIFDDIRVFQDTMPRARRLVNEGLLCALSIVLMDRERPIGVLGLFANKPGFFTPEYVEIAVEIASQLAIAIRHLNLSEDLRHHRDHLAQLVEERTAQLQLAKERVEAILNNTSDGILLIYADLNIQQTNSSFNFLFGCEQDDYFGKTLASIIDTEDVDLVTQTVQVAVAEKLGKTIEIRALRKDGTVFDADLSIGYIEDNALVCTIRDISERKQQERQLRYHGSLQENVSDAVIVTDKAFRIQSWNRAAERIYGWRAEEVVGKPVPEILRSQFSDPGDRERSAQQLRDNGWWQGEVIQHHKNGSSRYILGSVTQVNDESGLPFGIVSVNHDVSEQKQVEEALRESEEKFRLLMDAAPVAVVITNQIGQISLINNEAEILLGYSRAELVGQLVDVLVPEYARELHADNLATYMAEPRVRQMGSGLDLFAQRKDGSEFPVEIQLSYIETRTGLLVASFVVDITERKQNAAALEQQRAFLRSVIDFSPNTIFVKDYDARFVLANRLTAQLYNTTVEALIGKSDADFNPSLQEAQAFLEADRRVISTGEPLFLEEPITNFSGETRWLQTTKVPLVSVDGKSKYVLGVSTDITERKQAEIALREQHEFLQQVINNLPELITVKDRAGRFQLVNKREAEVHSSTPAAMLGKTNADFNPNQAEINFFIKKDRETLETGQTIFIPEETVFGRYYQTTKIPLKNQDGEYDRLLVVASDITERKQAEEALRQAFEKEKELGELKSRFVSMASHEFRTPLATILATTETLSAYRQKMTETQIDARLGKIREQVDHLKDIMEDVLQLAKLQARRVEFNSVKLDLDAMCRSVLDEFQSRPAITHELLYSCDDILREVFLDKKLIRQIISNLVSNAIKYSPDGKIITVSLEYIGNALVLQVRDEGIGIPEADLVHLFEPFHRATNVGTISGTGLGLTIIKESVELHDGTLSVDSQEGVGTTFTVNIPLVINGKQVNDKNPGD